MPVGELCGAGAVEVVESAKQRLVGRIRIISAAAMESFRRLELDIKESPRQRKVCAEQEVRKMRVE